MTTRFQTPAGDERVAPRHVCHLGEWNKGIDVAAEAVIAGLRAGEFCFLSGDRRARKAVLKRLESLGIEPSKKIEEGLLTELPPQNTGMALLGCVATHFGRCEQGFRLVGFPVWDKSGWPELHDVLAYESWLDDLVSKYHASLCLCIYDQTVAPPLVVNAHPKILVDSKLGDNPAYMPGPEFRRYLRRRAEVG